MYVLLMWQLSKKYYIFMKILILHLEKTISILILKIKRIFKKRPFMKQKGFSEFENMKIEIRILLFRFHIMQFGWDNQNHKHLDWVYKI